MSGRIEVLKTRAAFDLDCPAEQLTTTSLGNDRTYGVSGCGKRATYVGASACNGRMPASSCQWIMNTEQPPSSGGAAAPGG